MLDGMPDRGHTAGVGRQMKKVLMGNHAISWGARLADVDVIAAYPITPQSQVVELLSEMCADGSLNAKFLKVESEHSAMAACIGASAAGARAFTATSSQGLALMHEMLFWATGARTPVVMANINRAMGPPWNIWTEQTDSLAQRDTGWMQIYCQNDQEVLDSIIQAFRVSEEALLPTMVVLDAFVLSHTMEPVDIPDSGQVKRFLPPFDPPFKLEPSSPRAFGGLGGTDAYFELRYKIQEAMAASEQLWEETGREYGRLFGRKYGLIEAYRAEDAEICIITSSSIASTARVVVDRLREEGKRVGLLRIRVFRPFPVKAVRSVLSSVKKALVIDRNISFGASGIFYQEVKAAVYGASERPPIFGFITGLGGRDVTADDIAGMVRMVERMQEPREEIMFEGVRL
jgi:pyruvate/2-oxoacid:ferredoxin oxidoreductase alpha subunit